MRINRVLTIRISIIAIQIILFAIFFFNIREMTTFSPSVVLSLWWILSIYPLAEYIFRIPPRIINERQRKYYESLPMPAKQGIRRGLLASQLFIFTALVLGFYIGFGGLAINMPPWVHLMSPNAVFYILPYSVIFLMVVWCFAVAGTIIAISLPLARLASGSASVQWQIFQRIRPLFSRFFWGLYALAVVLAIVTQSSFAAVTNKGVDLENYWGISGKSYKWSEIKSLQDVVLDHYIIEFNDGVKWTGNIYSYEAMKFISSKSGKNIEEKY